MKELEKYIGTMVAVAQGVKRLCVGYTVDPTWGALIVESNDAEGWTTLEDTDVIGLSCEYYEYCGIPKGDPVRNEFRTCCGSPVGDPATNEFYEHVPTIQESINDLEARGFIITRVDNGFTVRHPNGSQTFHEQLSERIC